MALKRSCENQRRYGCLVPVAQDPSISVPRQYAMDPPFFLGAWSCPCCPSSQTFPPSMSSSEDSMMSRAAAAKPASLTCLKPDMAQGWAVAESSGPFGPNSPNPALETAPCKDHRWSFQEFWPAWNHDSSKSEINLFGLGSESVG
jgi:hypothetical protein